MKNNKSFWTIMMIVCAVICIASITVIIYLNLSDKSAQDKIDKAVIESNETADNVEPVVPDEEKKEPVIPEEEKKEPVITEEDTSIEAPNEDDLDESSEEDKLSDENPEEQSEDDNTSEQTAEEPPQEPKNETVYEQELPDYTSSADIDFDYLKGINSDIYAWIQINGTDQGYPILSNEDDPDYYIHRNVEGRYSSAGSIYTQSNYNSTDFSDACTVVYGHNMANGSMFGSIQRLSRNIDLNSGRNSNYFTIYTPDGSLTYRIWGMGVFTMDHLLYYYAFDLESDFNQFFSDFESFDYGPRIISSEVTPEYGDRIVILSTCYSQDNSYRFLTIGVLQ